MTRLLRGLKWISLIFILLGLSTAYPQVQGQNLSKTDTISHLVVDSVNGQVLSSQNAEQPVEVGALTKVLALYMVYKAVDEGRIALDDNVPISDEAYNLSQDYNVFNVPLRQDFPYTVKELVDAVLITGANGATLALAEYVSGSEEAFVKEMQAQLEEWQIKGARLYNATGLATGFVPHSIETINDGQVNRMSASACAMAAYHLLKHHRDLLDVSQQTKAVFKADTDDPFEMSTTIGMLPGMSYEYKGVNGFMLGTSLKDGDSALITSYRDDISTITVVLGTGSQGDGQRYNETAKLLDYIYATYIRELIVKKGQEVTQIAQTQIANGEAKAAILDYGRELSLVVPIIDTAPRYVYTFEPIKKYFNEAGALVAPLKAGTRIGSIRVEVENSPATYLPTAQANAVEVILRESIKEAPWYTQVWNGMGQAVDSSWEATRKFFTNLFN